MPTRSHVVVLDPGHGGSVVAGGSSPNRASGAHGLLEKDLALDVARRTRDLLAGVADVRLTRDGDANLPLAGRAQMAREANAAVFLSLHFNGSADRNQDGTATWISRGAGERSRRFAQSVSGGAAQSLGVSNLGTRERDIGVLLGSRHSPVTAACLAELAYLTNPREEANLENGDTRQRLAAALAETIRKFLALEAAASALDTFTGTAPHVLEFRQTNLRAASLASRGSSLRQKAVEILTAMNDLGIRNTPAGRRDAYVDVLMWGEPDPRVRASYASCPRDANGSCILSSCGLVVRSVLRLLGARDPLLDPPYRTGRAISNTIEFAQKNNALINVTRARDIEAANLEPGDIVFMNRGSRQHIFMITERDGSRFRSVDGGQANPGDGPCCGIAARERTLSAGSLSFNGETRPITRIIKLDRLPFTAEVIELVRKNAVQTQALAVIGAGRAVVDCPNLASHGPARQNLVMRWNVPPVCLQEVDVAVHLHGFVGTRGRLDLDARDRISGVGFSNASGQHRQRLMLALTPRGQQTSRTSSDGGSWVVEFPALTDSASGLNDFVTWSLDHFARTQLSQPAGSLSRGRLVLLAHSGGGARLMRLLSQADPDEIHFFDALYGSSTAAQAWVRRHIQRDAAALAGVNADQWGAWMTRSGGALRALFHPNSGTASPNRALHDAIECTLATVSNPQLRAFLRRYYRVESTTLGHNEIPQRYTSQILVDAGADLAPSPSSLSAPGSCSARASSLQSAEATCPVQPARPADMPGGSAFLSLVMSELEPPSVQKWNEREQLIYDHLTRGNMPAALWNWQDVPVSFSETLPDRSQRTHTGVFRVMPDYLAIGGDSDYVLMPMDAITAQRVADHFCCLLPTAKMVLDIYREARRQNHHLTAIPRDYWRTGPRKQRSTWAYREHDQAIKAARAFPLGTLAAGHKKDVVISPQLEQVGGRNKLAFYGFFRADGTPWQGGPNGIASLAHEPTYADYSHGVRLVHPLMTVDGQTRTVESVLADRTLHRLLSNEGPVAQPRITAQRPAAASHASEELEQPCPADHDTDAPVVSSAQEVSYDDVIAGLHRRGLTTATTYDQYVRTVLTTGTVFGGTVRLHPDFLAKLQRAEQTFTSGGGSIAGVAPTSHHRRTMTFHGWGLGLDLNGSANPYVMHENGEASLDRQTGPVYHRISRLMLGRDSVIPADITRGAPSRARTERLYDALAQENAAMKRYFALITAPAAERTRVIATASARNADWRLIMGAASAPTADQLLQRVMDDWVILKGENGPAVSGRTYTQPPRVSGDRPLRRGSPASGFLALPRTLVLAMWDQGLAWGGIDIGGASGDIMHFDDAWSPIGQAVLAIRGKRRPART